MTDNVMSASAAEAERLEIEKLTAEAVANHVPLADSAFQQVDDEELDEHDAAEDYKQKLEDGSDEVAEEPLANGDKALLEGYAQWLGIQALDTWGRPDNPMSTARAVQAHLATNHEELDSMKYWQGSFWSHAGSHWVKVTDDDLKADLYRVLQDVHYTGRNQAGKPVLKPWAPNKSKISNVMEALGATLNVRSDVEMPAWLRVVRTSFDDQGEEVTVIDDADHGRLVACENVLVNPLTRQVMAHTARYFNGYALSFSYDPAAQCPQWLAFLESAWPGDDDSKRLLQEWFGYVLSGRTSLQKMMMMIGQKRSGKGTIARVLTALLGAVNVQGLTFDSFAETFGLEDLVNKPLAIIGDARTAGDQRMMQAATGKILSITGEDKLPVNRKFKSQLSVALPTRLMLMSNELTHFKDSSGAILDRMLLLFFRESFAGREDRTLEGRLMTELAGIFNWALDGHDLLLETGQFTRPQVSGDVIDDYRESVSPVQVWLEENCNHKMGACEGSGFLFERYEAWCLTHGYKAGRPSYFLRLVQTVWPKVVKHDGWLTYDDGKRVKGWDNIEWKRPA